ncbi:hypothetical protein lerEdw1_019819 [Lerista edwardsae]|nr:hypothetical protein lerEdw1_019819 [Lerista edwardsae]
MVGSPLLKATTSHFWKGARKHLSGLRNALNPPPKQRCILEAGRKGEVPGLATSSAACQYIRRESLQQRPTDSQFAASALERTLVCSPLPSQEATMSLVPAHCGEMMEFSSENEVQFYAADQPFAPKVAAFPALQLCACDLQTGGTFQVGIQVKLAEQGSARHFRTVVVIVVAIEKMKNKLAKATPFSDDDLMDMLNTVLDPVATDTCEFTFAASSICRFLRSISFRGVHDIDNKYLALNGPTQLVASHLEQANLSHAAKLEMALYIPQKPSQQPIALRLNGKKELCLACVQQGEHPMLRLEEADIMKDLDRARLGRFLFHRIDTADHHVRFESAACPGWFICTAGEPDQAVEMTNQPGGASITQYILQTAEEMGLA